jgi:hypothetical protein
VTRSQDLLNEEGLCDQREREVESVWGWPPQVPAAQPVRHRRGGLRWCSSPGQKEAYCGWRSIQGGVGEACGQCNRLLPLRGEQFDADYMTLYPNAVVPTLIHDGRVIIESTVIMHHVDDMLGGPSLTLAEPLARFRTKCEPGDES